MDEIDGKYKILVMVGVFDGKGGFRNYT